MKRRIVFYTFQTIALFWAGMVIWRTSGLDWNPYFGPGLGLFGALPISFLGMRIYFKKTSK